MEESTKDFVMYVHPSVITPSNKKARTWDEYEKREKENKYKSELMKSFKVSQTPTSTAIHIGYDEET
jgi:hypothetical protein